MATLKHRLLNTIPLNDLLYLNHIAITEQSETEILSNKTEYRLRYKGSDLGEHYDSEFIAVINGCWSLSEDVRQLNITHFQMNKKNPLLTVLSIVFIRDFIRAVVGRSAVFTIALDISRQHAADYGILELLMTAQFKDDLNYIDNTLLETLFWPGRSPTEFDAFGRVILREAFLDGIKEDWTQYLEARQVCETEAERPTITTPLPTMAALTDQLMTSIQAQLSPMIRAKLKRERHNAVIPTTMELPASPPATDVSENIPADEDVCDEDEHREVTEFFKDIISEIEKIVMRHCPELLNDPIYRIYSKRE